MRRCMAYGALIGAVIPVAVTALHALVPGAALFYLDPLIPIFWPASVLLLGFKDPAYPTIGEEYGWFIYCIGINMCVYAALGGLGWKAWSWVKEQNRIYRKK